MLDGSLLEQFRWIAIRSYRTIELAISNEHERADSFYFYVARVGLIDEDDIVSKGFYMYVCVFFYIMQCANVFKCIRAIIYIRQVLS